MQHCTDEDAQCYKKENSYVNIEVRVLVWMLSH